MDHIYISSYLYSIYINRHEEGLVCRGVQCSSRGALIFVCQSCVSLSICNNTELTVEKYSGFQSLPCEEPTLGRHLSRSQFPFV